VASEVHATTRVWSSERADVASADGQMTMSATRPCAWDEGLSAFPTARAFELPANPHRTVAAGLERPPPGALVSPQPVLEPLSPDP
jgi:hypothetical protein